MILQPFFLEMLCFEIPVHALSFPHYYSNFKKQLSLMLVTFISVFKASAMIKCTINTDCPIVPLIMMIIVNSMM